MKLRLIPALFFLCCAAVASATAERADNFVLLDHTGAAHELYYQSDAKAVVLIAQGNGCDIVQANVAAYKALRDDYRA